MKIDIEYKILNDLVSNINRVLFVRDALSENYDIIYINDAYESLWGRSKQSLIDNPASYIESVHPDDQEMVSNMFIEFLEKHIDYEKDFNTYYSLYRSSHVWTKKCDAIFRNGDSLKVISFTIRNDDHKIQNK